MKKLSRQEMKGAKGGNWVIIGCYVQCVYVGDPDYTTSDFWELVPNCSGDTTSLACWGSGYASSQGSCYCINRVINPV